MNRICVLLKPYLSSSFKRLSINNQPRVRLKLDIARHYHSNKMVTEIIKSPEDSRLYRGYTLPNKLQILLISDAATEKSAAAIDVNVGSLCDPEDVLGLAHFLEHMLFLGTGKYPVENEYTQYLSEHGGCSNACTKPNHTCYYFDVLPEHLPGALDRFSQFFIAPLFTESATSRELKAVNSEHEKNILSDDWRLGQLDRFISKENHAYRKFSTGNKKTLEDDPVANGIDVRKRLLEFHDKWYSANNMRLVVLGKENLDELEALVTPFFTEVVNKDVVPPVWFDHPFGTDEMCVKASVVPIEDIRNLTMSFALPDYSDNYKAAPISYISHLIGHEGKGSLLSALKSRRWCNALTSGGITPAKGFSMFNVVTELTEEGLDNVDNVITLLFQYLNMIRKMGPQEWIFKEHNQLNAISFRFKDKEPPIRLVLQSASIMHKYPLEEVLIGPYLMTDWQPELVQEALDLLIPARVRVAVVAQAFEDIAHLEEPWYGTKYKLEKIDDELIKKWEQCGLCTDLEPPTPNLFIPENFDILPADEGGSSKHPTLIHFTELSRLWFKQDDTFRLPKALIKFDMYSPLAKLDPLNANLCFMYAELIKDSLNEFSYDALLAGLDWEVNNSKYGIQLSVVGYNDKLQVLFDKIVDRMISYKVDETRFDLIKETYVRALHNFEMKQPYLQASFYLDSLLAEVAFNHEQMLAVTDQVTPRALTEFIPCLLHRLHIEGLAYGNLNKETALSYICSVEEKLHKNGAVLTLIPQQLLLDREIQLRDGSHVVFELRNKVHVCSSTETYFQCGVRSTQTNTELELLSRILNEPCFNVLRTQEQLGYLVWSGVRRSHGVQGFRFILQSDRHPEYLIQRIEAFLTYSRKLLCDLSEEDFEKHKQSLIALRLEKPKNLSQQFTMFWGEIVSQQYHFSRVDVEVAYLRTITKQQIVEFFDKYIALGAPKRNQLSVYIISDAKGGAGDCLDKQVECPDVPNFTPPVPIEDVTSFKRSHGLFPLPHPYIDFNQTKSKL